MSGSLHIFRRNVVNGTPFFQVNYNLAGRTFAKVLDGEGQLDEFLEVATALPEDLIAEAWKQLESIGVANIVDIDFGESKAVAHGMTAAPTDF